MDSVGSHPDQRHGVDSFVSQPDVWGEAWGFRNRTTLTLTLVQPRYTIRT